MVESATERERHGIFLVFIHKRIYFNLLILMDCISKADLRDWKLLVAVAGNGVSKTNLQNKICQTKMQS